MTRPQEWADEPEDPIEPIEPDDVDDDDGGDDGDDDDSEDAEDEAEDAVEAAEIEDPTGKKVEDPDAVLEYADRPLPKEAEVRAAMEWAFEAERDADDRLLSIFTQHALMILEGNKRMNLTAITDLKEVAAKHYLDSWRLTQFLPMMGRTMLDLGSGAGFPGIPLAVGEPNASMTLIDSTRKRTDFMEECVTGLGLKNCKVVWDRAEEHLARNKYDIVVMRAISSVRENVRLLRKVRHSHKDLVMLKGPSWSREVRAGEREAERLGFRLDTVFEHELPDGMGARGILVYRAPGGHGE